LLASIYLTYLLTYLPNRLTDVHAAVSKHFMFIKIHCNPLKVIHSRLATITKTQPLLLRGRFLTQTQIWWSTIGSAVVSGVYSSPARNSLHTNRQTNKQQSSQCKQITYID